MKSDRAETYRRIQKIYEMICQGLNSVNIVEYARKEWKISNKRTYQLIRICLTWVKNKTEKTLEELRLEANIRYDDLYRKLYQNGEFKDAGYIQTQKNKVNGLEVQNIDLTSKGKELKLLTIGQLRQKYQEINNE
jgi:hypothetical protein